MFLTYVSGHDSNLQKLLIPSIGDHVEISFELQDSPLQKIHFHARVVRSDLKSQGIAFEKPEYANLQRVLAYTKTCQANESEKRALPATTNSAFASSQLLDAIREQAIKHINALTATYLLKQSGILLEMAGKSRDISEQNAHFEALTVFGKRRGDFKNAFEVKMDHILNAKPGPISEDLSLDEKELRLSSLSLVEDDAIDDSSVQNLFLRFSGSDKIYRYQQSRISGLL